MRYAKAIVAGIVAVAGTVAQAIDDDNISIEEAGGIAAAVVAAIGLVYAVRNRAA